MLIGAVIGAMLFGRPAPDASSGAVRGLGRPCRAGRRRPLRRGGCPVVASGGIPRCGDRRWSGRDCRARPIGRCAAGFSVRPLVVVGMLSYGLYLWHWPVLVIFDQQRTGVDGLPLMLLRLIISVSAACGQLRPGGAARSAAERSDGDGAEGPLCPLHCPLRWCLPSSHDRPLCLRPSAVTLQADAPGSTFEPSSLPETTDPPVRGTAVSDDGIAPATTAAPTSSQVCCARRFGRAHDYRWRGQRRRSAVHTMDTGGRPRSTPRLLR